MTISKQLRFLALITPLLVSLAIQVAAAEAEFSRVTLLVEGMMKSRGGVT